MSAESMGSMESTPEVFDVPREVKDALGSQIAWYNIINNARNEIDNYVAYVISLCDINDVDKQSTVSAKSIWKVLQMVNLDAGEREKQLVDDAVDIVWDYVRITAQKLGLMD